MSGSAWTPWSNDIRIPPARAGHAAERLADPHRRPRGKKLPGDADLPPQGEKPGPEERLGGFGKPVEHPPREDEPLPGEIIRTGKTVLGAKLLYELEGVGLVREEAGRPPFHGAAVLLGGAHLPD